MSKETKKVDRILKISKRKWKSGQRRRTFREEQIQVAENHGDLSFLTEMLNNNEILLFSLTGLAQ